MRVFDPYDDVVTELDADRRTVAQLRDALAPIEFDHPIEAVVTAEPTAAVVVVGRGGRRILVKAAAAVAIVAGMIASNLGDHTDNVASAEWTPQSQPVTDLERAQIESACDSTARPPEADPAGTVTVPEIDDPGSDLPVPALALDPRFDGALIDRRGDIAAVVATTADVSLECAARFVDGEWYAFATGVGWGGETTHPTVSSAWGGDAEITMISGLAPNATSVEIDAPTSCPGPPPSSTAATYCGCRHRTRGNATRRSPYDRSTPTAPCSPPSKSASTLPHADRRDPAHWKRRRAQPREYVVRHRPSRLLHLRCVDATHPDPRQRMGEADRGRAPSTHPGKRGH